MKQAENRALVEGYLNQINLESYTKDSKKYMRGEIEIAIPNDAGELDTVVPVSVFVGEKKKDGSDNSAYKGLITLQSEYKSIAATGDKDVSDKIAIGLGNLAMNEFVTPQGTVVSYPRISSNFFNRVTGEFSPKSQFVMTIVVGQITQELNGEGDETGRLQIKGIVPQYGDKVDLMTFFVESKEAIAHISSNWKDGDTVRVAGRIEFSVVKDRVEVEVAFGDPVFEEKTRTKRELVITSGSQGGLDESEGGYNQEEIKTALAERSAKLEEMKVRAASKASGNAQPSFSSDNLGF